MEKLIRTGRVATAIVLLLAILVANLVFFFVVPVRAEPLDQYHSGWKLIRETADEDGSDFLATYNLPIHGNFANKDSATVTNGGPYQIRSYAGGGAGTEFQSSGSTWMFVLCAKNYDVGSDNVIDNTFSFNIVGWSRINGMLQVIAEGDCILGTQAVITYPVDSSHALDTDAVGALVDMTAVTYTHSSTTFAKTDVGLNVVAGMMAYVTGTNLTDGYYAITTVTDNDNIIMSGMASSNNNTDSTVQINPAFWVDTINLDETTKWGGALADPNTIYGYYQMPGTIAVINSGDNEVAAIVVETKGLEWVQFVVYDALPAQSGEAGDVTVYGRPY